MKYVFAVASLLAGSAVAQTLSACGTLCINNMLALAPSLGCPPVNGAPSAACLCANANFAFGIRDCAMQACGATDATAIIAYGTAYCAAASASAGGAGGATGTVVTVSSAVATATATATGAGGAGGATGTGAGGATGTGAGGAGATGTAGATGPLEPVAISTVPVVSSGAAGATTIGSSTIYSSEAGAVAIATSPIASLETAGGSTFTSIVGSTTIYGPAGAAGGAGGASTVPIVSTGPGGVLTTIGSTVVGGGSGSGATGTGAGGAGASGTGSKTSSSAAGGAHQTVAAGFMAIAGLAALVL